jgi:soluble lytic murein transglycosylase-like protein
MARLVATIALLLTAALPSVAASAEQMYSFVDRDGVIHVTNVPQDRRYRHIRARVRTTGDLHRVTIKGRRSAPPLLRRESPYDEHIRMAAERHRIAPPLLKAVMAVESNFDPSAVSHKGASGLMQLMPATAREMFVADIFDPAQNIDGGARYLRHLQDRFGGDLEKVLAAYNAGPEAVRRSGGGIPRIPETQEYVRKVIALYDEYMRSR